MKKFYAVGTVIILLLGVGVFYLRSHQRDEGLHYERAETELVISPAPDATLTLLKAANDLQDAVMMPPLTDDRIWLPRGNYFLKVEQSANTFFYPIPIVAYRGGPDKDGAFGITIRPPLADAPHGLSPNLRDYKFIPSGHFLFGDHQRVQEPHYVWLGAYYMSSFEVTNADYREFLIDPRGYADETNWTEEGRKWRPITPHTRQHS